MPKVLKYTTLDSFTRTPFSGNPCAVIVLDDPLDDVTQQLIAREFNFSETAFLVPHPENCTPETHEYGLRWFTPKVEVKLCGHATLGAAQALFSSEGLLPGTVKTLVFTTLSGHLEARRVDNGQIELRFPAELAERAEIPESVRQTVAKAVGSATIIKDIWRGTEGLRRWLVAELDPTVDIKSLSVDINAVGSLPKEFEVLAITAPAEAPCDFYSRLFAPSVGIPEDPVTGSLHCLLGPFWAGRLGKEAVRGRQLSEREGEIDVVWSEGASTCTLRGSAVVMCRGELYF